VEGMRGIKELGSRLKALRESMGLSLVEASKRLGFSNYQTLRNIELGKREVRAVELPLFQRVYFCSLSEILGKNKSKKGSLLWRKTPVRKQEIERQIFYQCEQYHLLERLLNVDLNRDYEFCQIKSKDRIRTYFDIDTIADDTRNRMGLGKRPAFSLTKILEQNYGVKIIYIPLSDNGSAASMVDEDYGAVIVINADEAPWRRNYNLGHEMFHIITAPAITDEDLKNDSFLEGLEKNAERFASTLLLPEEEIKRELNFRMKSQNKITYSDLVDIARDFGVSTSALVYRLSNLKLINWDDANKLATNEELKEIDKIARRGDKKNGYLISERFMALAVRCLRKGLISRGKFAEMMQIDRSDIDIFIEQFGLLETEGLKVGIMDS